MDPDKTYLTRRWKHFSQSLVMPLPVVEVSLKFSSFHVMPASASASKQPSFTSFRPLRSTLSSRALVNSFTTWSYLHFDRSRNVHTGSICVEMRSHFCYIMYVQLKCVREWMKVATYSSTGTWVAIYAMSATRMPSMGLRSYFNSKLASLCQGHQSFSAHNCATQV